MSVCENVTSATLSFSGSQQVKEKKKITSTGFCFQFPDETENPNR